MIRGAIPYKGNWLAPGSESHRLYQEKKFKELDAHERELERKKKELEGAA